MYCSLDEAWDSKNSIDKLSERYKEHFKNNELTPYIIKDSTNKTLIPEKSPVFLPRKDARYNTPKNTVYNKDLEMQDEINIYSDSELKTEDILLKTEEFKSEKNEKSNDMNCHELIEKVMKCETCKEILIKKLKINNNFSFNSIINNEVKEVLILIMIGLVIIIAVDILIRVVR